MTDIKDLRVDIERIKQDIYTIGRFGYNPDDQGVYRQGFSNEDMRARFWLMEQMQELALDVEMDGAANVIGRYGSAEDKVLIIASHLDSVPAGGMFDGVAEIVLHAHGFGEQARRVRNAHDVSAGIVVAVFPGPRQA